MKKKCDSCKAQRGLLTHFGKGDQSRDHMMCVMCVPCSRFNTCEVCNLWSPEDWKMVEDHRYQQLAKLPGG